MKKIMFAALAATLLAGCYKVDIFWTNHPETARIILTTDWSKRSPDAAMPDPYGIHLLSPDLSWMVSETRFEIPNLFEPGTYTLQVCNAAEYPTRRHDRLALLGTHYLLPADKVFRGFGGGLLFLPNSGVLFLGQRDADNRGRPRL